jgi:hypothetical protein
MQDGRSSAWMVRALTEKTKEKIVGGYDNAPAFPADGRQEGGNSSINLSGRFRFFVQNGAGRSLFLVKRLLVAPFLSRSPYRADLIRLPNAVALGWASLTNRRARFPRGSKTCQ